MLVKRTKSIQLYLLRITRITNRPCDGHGTVSRGPNVAEHQIPDARKRYRKVLRSLLTESGKSKEAPKEYWDWMLDTADGK